jgi:acyl-CoA thioester hydrolase
VAELFITYRGTVYPHQCDHVGHMNVMWYVGKFDEATWQMFGMVGLTPERLRSRGWGIAATRQNLAYRRELRSGDLLSVRSGILEIRPLQIRFYHEMLNDGHGGEVAAACQITGLLLDAELCKPVAFPEDVIEAAQQRVVNVALLV